MSNSNVLFSNEIEISEEILKDLKILTVGGFKNLIGDVDVVKSKRKAKDYFSGKPPLVDINNTFPETDFTPLMCACWVGNNKIINILINNGAEAVGNNKEIPSAFHIIVTKNNMDLLLEFINKFPNDINHQDKNGNTALMIAAELKNPEMMKILIENNADLKLMNNKGHTAYDIATEKINEEALKWLNYYLLKEKITINDKENNRNEVVKKRAKI